VLIEGPDSDARTPSPYRPGFGSRPTVIAGRDDLLADIDEAIEGIAQDGVAPSAFLLVGPRGVGKSVALDEIASRAQERHGWLHIHVQKDEGTLLNEVLAPAVDRAAADLAGLLPRSKDGLRLSELSVRGGLPFAGASATFNRGDEQPPPSPAIQLAERLRHLADLAVAADTGVVITLDEIQGVSKAEFGTFGTFCQEITRHHLPFLVAAAGLPTVDNDRLPTYFVRGERHDLGMLSPAEARLALLEPARLAGRPFTPEAADRLLAETGGYPFAVQIHGRQAWRESSGAPSINLAAVERAIPVAADRLDRTVHREHWQTASPLERRYMIAVADLIATGDRFTGADVARSLGQAPASMTAVRARLIIAGAITYDGDQLDFATPGMASYVSTRAESRDTEPARAQRTELKPGDASRMPKPAQRRPASGPQQER
jgi:hypothetical protein